MGDTHSKAGTGSIYQGLNRLIGRGVQVITMAGLFTASHALAGEPNVTFDQSGGGSGSAIEYARQNFAAPASPAPAQADTGWSKTVYFPHDPALGVFASNQKNAKLTGSFIFEDGNLVNAQMDKANLETEPGSHSAVPSEGLGYDLSSMVGTYEIQSPKDGLACIIGMDRKGNAKAFSDRAAMMSQESDVDLLIRRVSPHVLVLSCSMAKQANKFHTVADEKPGTVTHCGCHWEGGVCPPPVVGPCRTYVCTCWN